MTAHAPRSVADAKRSVLQVSRTAPGSGAGALGAAWRPAHEHELHAAASRRANLTRCGCEDREEVRSRAPEELDADEVATQAPAPASAPASAPAAAPAKASCSVKSGPTYAPTGSVPVVTSGGRKRAKFRLAATFGSADGAAPRCCEVRQYIRWDAASHKALGGPPHNGFPTGATAGTWYEDRDAADKRYGHRSGTHSDPVGSCGDEYTSAGKRDQANGDTYCGSDGPNGPAATMSGKWDFQLKVIDVCNGGAEKASSSVITIDWS